MNVIILGLLVISEIVVAIKCITTEMDRATYRKIRLIANLGELLLPIVFLPMKEVSLGLRFALLFGLLAVRSVIALILWMIREEKMRRLKKSSIVLWATGQMVFFLIGLLPSFVFTDYNGLPTTGQYQVKKTSAILVDGSRVEEFEQDGSFREIPIYVFYPDTADGENTTFPVVFFSHGAFGYYASNMSTYMELASHGYVVISLEHPYHSFFTKDTSGKTILVDRDFMSSVMTMGSSETASEEEIYEASEAWVTLRLEDMNRAIDSVKEAALDRSTLGDWYCEDDERMLEAISLCDVGRIGLMGHSLGGAAAVSMGRARTDIGAVIDFDGTMLGEISGVENGVDIITEEPYPIPLLTFDSEVHYNQRAEARENGQIYVNNVILDYAVEGYETYIKGTEHMNYTDLPLFSPMLAGALGLGTVDSEKCICKMNQITVDFFDCFLKGQGEFEVEECYELSED